MAGSTGRLGARIVRELLGKGFKVGGCRQRRRCTVRMWRLPGCSWLMSEDAPCASCLPCVKLTDSVCLLLLRTPCPAAPPLHLNRSPLLAAHPVLYCGSTSPESFAPMLCTRFAISQVRAGVRNPEKADTFLEIASSYGLLSKDELGRLTVRRGFEGH